MEPITDEEIERVGDDMKDYLKAQLDNCLEVLKGVETGKVTIEPVIPPADVYAGDVKYRADNGWEIVVFNDCDSWDYVSFMVSPNGNIINPWDKKYDDEEIMNELQAYRPPDDIGERIYKLRVSSRKLYTLSQYI